MSLGLRLGLGLQRRAGSSFSPLSLSPTAWYDPSDASTLYQTGTRGAPGTAAASTNPVGLLLDKSGNANDATQSTAGSRPILNVSSGLSSLVFDGVDDFLKTAAFGAALTQPNSISVAFQITTLASVKGGNNYIVGGLGGVEQALAQLTTDDKLFMYSGGAPVTVGSALAINTSYVVTLLFAGGGSGTLRMNGVQIATGISIGTDSFAGITLGASGSQAQNGFVKIFGYIARDTPWSGSEQASVETYLGAKAGLVL